MPLTALLITLKSASLMEVYLSIQIGYSGKTLLTLQLGFEHGQVTHTRRQLGYMLTLGLISEKQIKRTCTPCSKTKTLLVETLLTILIVTRLAVKHTAPTDLIVEAFCLELQEERNSAGLRMICQTEVLQVGTVTL
jgi:hypothetical protein